MPTNASPLHISPENSLVRPLKPRFWLVLVLIYALITAILFGWTLWGAYFFSDDFTWIWHGSKIGLNIYNVLTFRMSSFYSPVLNLFYTAMGRIFGYFAPAYFTFGLFVHVTNSLIAAVIAWQLSRSRRIAALTGLLFVLAGGAFEPLIWIGANMHSIATLFIFLGLVGYLAFLNGGHKIYLLFSFFAAILAIGSKEIAAIFPLLALAILFIFWRKYKGKIFTKAHLCYWAAIIILFLLYGWQQFIWQKQSVDVASGTFAFSWHVIAKLPIVILDLFVPLGEITPGLHRLGVGLLILISLILIGGIIYAYRKLLLIRLGFLWMLIAVLPTIMLTTANWWDPLASRYTYLPRFGMIIVLVAILDYHLNRRASSWLFGAIIGIIVIFSGWQLIYMYEIINRDYPYVYNTGRSLETAMLQVKKDSPLRLYVRADHPFANNNAYLVGAAVTIAGLDENAVFFPPAENNIKLKKSDALLYWDANAREFKIKTSAR